MKEFEEYFSFEAIVGDLIRWRVKGRDVGKVLPSRREWSRAGAKAREGVSPEAVRRQSIWRAVMRECEDVGNCCQCGIVANSQFPVSIAGSGHWPLATGTGNTGNIGNTSNPGALAEGFNSSEFLSRRP